VAWRSQELNLLIFRPGDTTWKCPRWLLALQNHFAITHVEDAQLASELARDGSCLLLGVSEREDPCWQALSALVLRGDGALPVLAIVEDGRVATAVQALHMGADHVLAPAEATFERFPNAVEEFGLRAWGKRTVDDLAQASDITDAWNPPLAPMDLAHAILTPLAAVQEFVSLVKDGVTGDITDEQGKHLAFARGGCLKIEQVVARWLMELGAAKENSLEKTT
jgi:hypothetical protein